MWEPLYAHQGQMKVGKRGWAGSEQQKNQHLIYQTGTDLSDQMEEEDDAEAGKSGCRRNWEIETERERERVMEGEKENNDGKR